MASLNLRHIYKVYPNGAKAVNDFNMEIKDQEFIVFVGPSGCGKSTTLRMIAGLEEISAGELLINDRYVNYVEPKNRDIAMVFQNYALYPHLSVYENIAFGLKLRKFPKAVIDEKVKAAAEMLGLTEYLNNKPGALSGGQRQRVALGRALVREPQVFLLDEPLSNLDAKLRASMRNEITKLHKKLATPFIYVTHDQVEAMTMGDRIVVMKAGFIQQIDTPKNLYRYPINKFVAGFIGTPQMNFTDVKALKVNDKVIVSVDGTDTTFELPLSYLINVDPKYFDNTKPLSMAIRPEYLSTNPDQFEYKCKVKIAGVEELGTEVQILANFDTNADTLSLSTDDETVKANITIRADVDYVANIGDVIEISLDLKHIHLFDSVSEDVINPRKPNHARVEGLVEDKTLSFMGLNFELPSAIELENGKYNLEIPNSAIEINDLGQEVTVIKSELINDKYLITVEHNNEFLFIETDTNYNVNDKINVQVRLSMIDFYQGEEIVKPSLTLTNEIEGMVYYHKELNEEGKKVKVLDYLINGLAHSCYNPVAYRTFISNNDRSVFDLDLAFKFTASQLKVDENGPFIMRTKSILDYGKEKYLLLDYNGQEIIKLCDESEEITLDSDVHVSIDLDNTQVFDVKKNIRLA